MTFITSTLLKAGDLPFPPLRVEGEDFKVHLEDYVDDFKSIINVSIKYNDDFEWTRQKVFTLPQSQINQFVEILSIKTKSGELSIPIYRSSAKVKRFFFTDRMPQYKTVSIAGSFNGWSDAANKLKYERGRWSTDLTLDPGEYSYKLVLDGNWVCDPNNPDSLANGIGGYNSILRVEGAAKEEKPFLNAYLQSDQYYVRPNSESPGRYYIFWQNQLIQTVNREDDRPFGIAIPLEALEMDRSYIRVFGYNRTGRSNDVLIPLKNGVHIQRPDEINRKDKHAQVYYFMMLDRFVNGDRSNDAPLNDERVAKRADYQGGDLEGLIQTVNSGYFKKIGINSLWISPITENVEGAWQEYPEPKRFYSGYHGYWAVNNHKVESRFGTNQDFTKLIDVLHRDDMNIILDFVSNHVHQEHPMIKANPEWKTDLNLEDGRTNIRLWDEHRLTTWFDDFLPTIDLENSEAAEAMADTAMFWLENFDIDGYRHDATKHIPLSYWRLLNKKIQKENKNIYQVGETFGSRKLIGSYVGPGMMDGQFDFNLYFDIRDVLSQDGQSFKRVANSLEESLNFYGHHHLMANITGNHDLPRFISYAGGDLKFDEDPKAAGWEREIKVLNNEGYDRLQLLHSMLFFLPGIPCTYYGDEFGMPGANDPDNRRMMYFDNLSKEEMQTLANYQVLSNLRSDNLALIYGSTKVLLAEDDLLILKRSYFSDAVVLFINKSKEPIHFNLPDEAVFSAPEYVTRVLDVSDQDTRKIVIPPLSYELMYNYNKNK